MHYQTRHQREHLDLRQLADLPAHPRELPVQFPRARTAQDNAAHTREVRHARRTLRQQLHDVQRTAPDAQTDATIELEG